MDRSDRLEARLLEGLQKAALRAEVAEYTLTHLERQVADRLCGVDKGSEALRSRQAELERQIVNYTRALEDGYSPAITAAIAEREREYPLISEQIWVSESRPLSLRLTAFRQGALQRLFDLHHPLYVGVPPARAKLMRHVSTIVLKPEEESGKRLCVAADNWNPLGNESGPPNKAAPVSLRMVGGADTAPTALMIPFSIELPAVGRQLRGSA